MSAEKPSRRSPLELVKVIMVRARSMSEGSESPRRGKSQPKTFSPAAWAMGRKASMNWRALKPSQWEPMRG